jgi:hypothetical protein
VQHISASPSENCPPGTELKLAGVLLGDETYPLKEYPMRQCSRLELNARSSIQLQILQGTHNCGMCLRNIITKVEDPQGSDKL